MGGSDFVTVKKLNDKHVIVRFKWQKCTRDFFTKAGYNNHLFMDHKIRNVERHPPITVTNDDKLVTRSEPSGVSGDITRDDDVKAKMPGKSDELTSEKSLPDIPPLKKPVNVTSPVPEGDRDVEKFYCEYCTDSFYSIDGVRQHTDNKHFRHLDEIYGDNRNGIFVDDPVNSDDKNEGPQTHEKNSRGRTKRKREKSTKERNDSVSRRKWLRMATQQKETESSTEIIERR